MSLKLKVCGMRDPENIREVSKLQADYMGFIFYKESPRFVSEDFNLPDDFTLGIEKVGVFVNHTFGQITDLIDKHELDVVQLHGSEPPTLCERLKRSDVQVIKSFSVDADFNFDSTKAYSSVTDYFLFDTKGKYHGGNARVFDWDVLQRYDQQLPFFLSGGISPDNVHQVSKLKGMNLHGLDVNSGVEQQPGLKDVSRLKALQVEMLKAGI